ncbi:hypothetical protein CDAR_571431, partial [Caerostris darwini]
SMLTVNNLKYSLEVHCPDTAIRADSSNMRWGIICHINGQDSSNPDLPSTPMDISHRMGADSGL